MCHAVDGVSFVIKFWTDRMYGFGYRNATGYSASISPIWAEATTQAICIKNCAVGKLLDVITCANFNKTQFTFVKSIIARKT